MSYLLTKDSLKIDAKLIFKGKKVITFILNKECFVIGNLISKMTGFYEQIELWIKQKKLVLGVDYLVLEDSDVAKINGVLKTAGIDPFSPIIKRIFLFREYALKQYITSLRESGKETNIEYAAFLESNFNQLLGIQIAEQSKKPEFNSRSELLRQTALDIENKLKSLSEYIELVKAMAKLTGKDVAYIDGLFNDLNAIPKTLKEFAQLLEKQKNTEEYINCLSSIKKKLNIVDKMIDPFLCGIEVYD